MAPHRLLLSSALLLLLAASCAINPLPTPGVDTSQGGVSDVSGADGALAPDTGAPGDGGGASDVNQPPDVSGCGECPSVEGGSSTCVDGVCVPTCWESYGDCDGDLLRPDTNGCETPLDFDPANCGACGRTCDAGVECIERECYAPCPDGWTRCPDLQCYDVTSDPLRCGDCRTECVAPYAVTGCAASICAIAACQGTRVDANGRYSDGCECSPDGAERCNRRDDDCNGLTDDLPAAVLAADPENCGACRRRCPDGGPGAVATCGGGVCGLAPCPAGARNVDGVAANGCEYACAAAGEAEVPGNDRDDDCDGLTDVVAAPCHRRGAVCSAGGWCWEHPLPQGNELAAVWAGAPDDVWAIGGDGTAIHWDGRAWSGSCGPDAGGSGGSGAAVHGTGPTDVWAAVGGRLQRWDGRSWTAADLPPAEPWGASVVYDVRVFAPDDAWAVGRAGGVWRWDGASWQAAGPDTDEQLGVVWGRSGDDVLVGAWWGELWRWDGTRWTAEEPLPDRLGNQDLWDDGAGTLWAVSDVDSVFRRTAGGAWERVFDPYATLSALWGAAPDDVWALGLGAVAHFDGTRWRTLPWWEDLPYLQAVSGSGAADVWAVGRAGRIVRWAGDRWRPVTDAATDDDLAAVWVTGAEEAWALGREGTLLRRSAAGWDVERDLWATGGAPAALWASGPADVWAVGPVVRRFRGDGWPGVPGAPLGGTAVGGTGPDDVWIGGERGAMHRWDGERWRAHPLEPPLAIRQLSAAAPGAVWVVAGGSQESGARLFHFDGAAWHENAPPVALSEGELVSWAAVAAAAPDDVWVTGTLLVWQGHPLDQAAPVRPLLFHGDGTTWTETTLPDARFQPQALSTAAPDDVWLVGSGTAWHFDGAAWTPLPTGLAGWPTAVHALPGGPAFIVSYDGAILRRDPAAASR